MHASRFSSLFVAAAVCLAGSAAAPTTQQTEATIVQIRQRKSPQKRAAAVADLRAALAGEPAAQLAALVVLRQTGDIPFDRAGLDKLVVDMLGSTDYRVRAASLDALVAVHADDQCLPTIIKLADDPDPAVRAAVAGAYVGVGRVAAGTSPPEDQPILKLLGDKDEKVVVSTARMLWAVPLSPAVEQKVIELSRFPQGHEPTQNSIPQTMNYYVLSTRPVVSKPIADRLAEIIADPTLPGWHGRAVWGLGNHQVMAEASDVAFKSLSQEVDESLNPSDRHWAVWGLCMLRTPESRQKLRDIVDHDESDDLRKLAERYAARPAGQ